MKRPILIDTGPIVALINRQEDSHQWAKQEASKLATPFFTCEAVITEACFLLQNITGGTKAVMGLVKSQNLIISFNLNEDVDDINYLMEKYQSVPMSFADACLVRMSELIKGSSIFTLDSDFQIYKKHKKDIINLIIPNI